MPRNVAGSNTFLSYDVLFFAIATPMSINVTVIMANFLYLKICGHPAFVNGDVVNAQTWGKPRENPSEPS